MCADAATRFVYELETWRLAMTAALFPGATPPRQRLEVIVLQNRELEALHPTLRGWFVDEPYLGSFLLLGASVTSDRERIMKHELAHAVIEENLHDVPQWLNEGLAVFLETTDLDERTGEVEWGSQQGLWEPSQAARPSEELFAPWPPDRLAEFEYSAGQMVHMLERKHPVELQCLLSGLRDLEPYQHALLRCCPAREKWAWEYSHSFYESSGTLRKGRIPLDRRDVRARPLPDAATHALLALVNGMAAYQRPPKPRRVLELAADQHRRWALALDPTQILAASMTLRESKERQDREAEARLTARLVEQNPDDWRAWLWRANLASTPPDDARRALARAVALAPERFEVISLEAHAAVREDRWKDAAALARKAFILAPYSATNRRLLYIALEHLGRCDEAKAFIASDKAIEEEIRSLLAAGTLNRLHRCVEF